MKNIIFVTILSILISCSPKEGDKTEEQHNDNERLGTGMAMNQEYYDNFNNDSIRKTKLDRAFKEGDHSAYQSLSRDYMLGGDQRAEYELFYYSMKMLSKHQTSFAYRDAHLYFKKLNKDDKLFQILAQYYLKPPQFPMM